MSRRKSSTFRTIRTLLKLTALALGIVAVVQELQKPAEEREWHGIVAGVFPYDLRKPTVARARSTWWNPEEHRVFVPKVFGVGWTVNVGRVARVAGLV